MPRSAELFSFTGTAPTGSYTLSLHDALPIFEALDASAMTGKRKVMGRDMSASQTALAIDGDLHEHLGDRKSTRLNSSHGSISYAVFCLKKKNNVEIYRTLRESRLNLEYA